MNIIWWLTNEIFIEERIQVCKLHQQKNLLQKKVDHGHDFFGTFTPTKEKYFPTKERSPEILKKKLVG